jgi:hypothetical protein
MILRLMVELVRCFEFPGPVSEKYGYMLPNPAFMNCKGI